IQPDLAIAHYNLGLLYKAQGQFGAAIAAYQQALQLQPDYADAYQNLGVVYLKLGQIQNSLTAFQRAIALHQLDHPAEALRLQQALTEMGLPI
ncbi:MAG: tetratricopeptide repeat protein, partial [Thermosynechococcaceae cyanobacterium]